MRRRIYARTPSSPQRGTNTYMRSVMDRARVANKRANYRNNDYDYYDERTGQIEDYSGREPFMYSSSEDEFQGYSRSPYRGREDDEYLEESDTRNYSRRRENYGRSNERNYTNEREAGFLNHMPPSQRRRGRYEEREEEESNVFNRVRDRYGRNEREQREQEQEERERREPSFSIQRNRRNRRNRW